MEKKSVLDMMLDGWCDGCDGDPAACHAAGRCLCEKESEDKNDGSKEKSV